MIWLSWCLAFGTATSLLLVEQRKRTGWWVALFSNAGWALYSWKTAQPAFLALSIFLAAVSLRGLREWPPASSYVRGVGASRRTSTGVLLKAVPGLSVAGAATPTPQQKPPGSNAA